MRKLVFLSLFLIGYLFALSNSQLLKFMEENVELKKNDNQDNGKPNEKYNLRIMSYNIANFDNHKKWDERKLKIAEEIKDINPDIIGLQEIRFETNFESESYNPKNMLLDLAVLLPNYYQFEWIPIMYYDNTAEKVLVEGIGILSRHRILEKTVKFLSTNDDDSNKRAVIRTLIEINEKLTIEYFNTHITYGFAGQLDQSYEVMSYIDQCRNNSPIKYHQFLNGDTNFDLVNHRESYNFLTGLYYYKGNTGSLVDSWTQLYPEDEKSFTFNSWNPYERLDIIFYRENDKTTPIKMEIFGKGQSKHDFPSDHLGIYGDFVLELE